MPITSLEIEIYTADMPRGGTDDPVFCSVQLGSGAALVTEHRLDDPNRNDFEPGSRRRYSLPVRADVAQAANPDQIARITLR
jgi:hypothetical protein